MVTPAQNINKMQQVVDGPWSIVVGMSSFLAQAILGGYVFTAGIFYTIFREQFPDINDVVTTWLCNLPLTLWFLAGPLGSVLTNKFGCRACAVIGGLCSSIGLTLCFVSSNFYMVFMFYGILAGVGNGTHYVAFITVVNRYFRKYRLTANILTSIGATTGMAIYAAIIPLLTEVFGWKGTLLISGGLSFNLLALACLLFPTTPVTSSKNALNFRVLKDKSFMLFAFQCVLCNLSSSMIFLHLPALLLSFGQSMAVTSLSLTAYALANCGGKIFHSILGYFWKPDACVIYTCSLVICGSTMILFPFLHNKVWITCMAVILGSTYCVTGGYTPDVIIMLIGTEHISDGLGFGQVAKATGSLIAGPLAGLLYRWSHRYETSFYVSGSAMITSCLLMLPVIRTLRLGRKRGTTTDIIINTKITETETQNLCKTIK